MTEPPHITILCVDDEPAILNSLQRILRKINVSVALVNNAADALEYLRLNDVQMVISDMQMPIMSGARLFAQISRHYPHIYRILITGYADIESITETINPGGIHRYISKPWDNKSLLEEVVTGLANLQCAKQKARLQSELKKKP